MSNISTFPSSSFHLHLMVPFIRSTILVVSYVLSCTCTGFNCPTKSSGKCDMQDDALLSIPTRKWSQLNSTFRVSVMHSVDNRCNTAVLLGRPDFLLLDLQNL